jgi:hypothetical protein
MPDRSEGGCILEADCPRKELYTPVDLREYRDRLNRCSRFSATGRNFICCANIKSQPTKSPVVITSKRPIITTKETPTTIKATTVTQKLTNDVKPSVIENHKNFKFLDLIKCGTVAPRDRVSGGQNAGLGEFPWAALLGYESFGEIRFNCGGSLISSKKSSNRV